VADQEKDSSVADSLQDIDQRLFTEYGQGRQAKAAEEIGADKQKINQLLQPSMRELARKLEEHANQIAEEG
jgi:hypothetical protein